MEHVIAVTQFEPADARRAFPCWDEPEFKAVFAVTLVVDDQLTALSNASVASEEPAGEGRRRVRFHETMPMSTYLVAFVVGPFELTPPADVDGVPLRVAAVPGKSHLTEFAVEVGTHALRFLSQYFDLPYPADKIDHIAIPDFAFGAMENLGCVTYRENALLVDPPEASQLELQRVATVVAHETAHMWFGDLVTMKWWNGIWLNEAFATFMELAATDHYRPDWQVWSGFGSGKAAALATDGLRSTRPVEFPVGRPEEAEAMFDVLTYQKGGAVLRMLEQYIGPETFRKGISHYLSTHAHGNTETGDLWDAIEAVSGEPVRTIMDSWIFQGGYPLISVQAGDDRGTVQPVPTTVPLPRRPRGIAARRRRALGRPGQPAGFGRRGRAATAPARRRGHRRRSTSTARSTGWSSTTEPGASTGSITTSTCCRACSTSGLATVCDPLERMALVVDYWAGVVSGATSLDRWVDVVEALGDEEDPDVWAGVGSALRLLDLIAVDRDDRAALQAFVRRMAGRSWARLGWDRQPEESQRTGITRGRVLSVLGLTGNDSSLGEEALARFGRFLADKSGLAPDLLTPVAHVVSAWGGEEGWNSIMDQYRAGATPQDKIRYLIALPATRDPVLLARTLDLALGDEVRTQDGCFLIGEVMANRAGGALTWEWLERHWDEVRDRYPPSLIARSLESIAMLVDPAVAGAVHAFADSHELPLAGPRLDQVLERMDINVALASRLRGTLAAAFSR